MDAYPDNDDHKAEPDLERRPDEPSGARLSGVPLRDCDHCELLRVIIGEGAEAAMETFFEAKDPNIDPLLKLKLMGLASSLGDNVRKAIATHATHFWDQR